MTGCALSCQMIQACEDTAGPVAMSSDGAFQVVATTRACPLKARRLSVELSSSGLWPFNAKKVLAVSGPYSASLAWSGRRTLTIVVTPQIVDDTNGAHFREHSERVDRWRDVQVQIQYIPDKSGN